MKPDLAEHMSGYWKTISYPLFWLYYPFPRLLFGLLHHIWNTIDFLSCSRPFIYFQSLPPVSQYSLNLLTLSGPSCQLLHSRAEFLRKHLLKNIFSCASSHVWGNFSIMYTKILHSAPSNDPLKNVFKTWKKLPFPILGAADSLILKAITLTSTVSGFLYQPSLVLHGVYVYFETKTYFFCCVFRWYLAQWKSSLVVGLPGRIVIMTMAAQH